VVEQGKTIADLWDGNVLKCSFRRNLSPELYGVWLEVNELVSTIHLSNDEDSLIWQFSTKGTYSSQSLYKIINFRGIHLVHVPALWSIKVPPRVMFFLWLLANNRILTRDNLAKRKKMEDKSCLFCCEEESVQHLFFQCVVAKQCWCIISNILGISVEESLIDIGKFWLSNKKHTVVNIVIAAVLWNLWKLRNELCFQRAGWRSMEILLHRIGGVLQNWVILCPQEKKQQLLEVINKTQEAAREVLWLPFQVVI
jgi:hypothetical protein